MTASNFKFNCFHGCLFSYKITAKPCAAWKKNEQMQCFSAVKTAVILSPKMSESGSVIKQHYVWKPCKYCKTCTRFSNQNGVLIPGGTTFENKMNPFVRRGFFMMYGNEKMLAFLSEHTT